jgi:hypothetical protein
MCYLSPELKRHAKHIQCICWDFLPNKVRLEPPHAPHRAGDTMHCAVPLLLLTRYALVYYYVPVRSSASSWSIITHGPA